MSLIVLCWGWSSRLDEFGFAGYSVHSDVASSQIWTKNSCRVANERIPGSSGIFSYYQCGDGKIEKPSQELLLELGDKDGVFINKEPEGFILLSGRIPRD